MLLVLFILIIIVPAFWGFILFLRGEGIEEFWGGLGLGLIVSLILCGIFWAIYDLGVSAENFWIHTDKHSLVALPGHSDKYIGTAHDGNDTVYQYVDRENGMNVMNSSYTSSPLSPTVKYDSPVTPYIDTVTGYYENGWIWPWPTTGVDRVEYVLHISKDQVIKNYSVGK
jgi:hypothetical protein